MLDDTWSTKPATELAAAIRSKQVKSRELLELYLDRIERLNGGINAVVTLATDRAFAEADAADARSASGADLPPLHGLPITIKDAIETEGIRSTGGAVELRDHVPTADAPAVARLRAAGAVVFGKTNLPRWSGDLQSYNEIFGTTNNPWDHSRIPGGSSGGAAAAVAAGLTSFELGTDIGGSVRLPSHCCGTFALKPTFGVVPQRGYLDSVGGGSTDADINVFGPIARSAADLELLMSVLAGPEPARSPAWRVELPPPGPPTLAGRRIAIWLDDPVAPTDHEMLGLLRKAAEAAASAGAIVTEVRPPVDPAEQIDLFSNLIVPAISVSLGDDGEAAAGSHAAWLRNDRARAALQSTWARWFGDYDALLTPVMPLPAFEHMQDGEPGTRRLTVNGVQRPYIDSIFWTGMFGVVYLPVAVAPVGETADGIPVGMQVVAPYLHDRIAIAIAGALGDVTRGYRVPPGC